MAVAADVGGVGAPVSTGDFLPLDGGLDVDAEGLGQDPQLRGGAPSCREKPGQIRDRRDHASRRRRRQAPHPQNRQARQPVHPARRIGRTAEQIGQRPAFEPRYAPVNLLPPDDPPVNPARIKRTRRITLPALP